MGELEEAIAASADSKLGVPLIGFFPFLLAAAMSVADARYYGLVMLSLFVRDPLLLLFFVSPPFLRIAVLAFVSIVKDKIPRQPSLDGSTLHYK